MRAELMSDPSERFDSHHRGVFIRADSHGEGIEDQILFIYAVLGGFSDYTLGYG